MTNFTKMSSKTARVPSASHAKLLWKARSTAHNLCIGTTTACSSEFAMSGCTMTTIAKDASLEMLCMAIGMCLRSRPAIRIRWTRTRLTATNNFGGGCDGVSCNTDGLRFCQVNWVHRLGWLGIAWWNCLILESFLYRLESPLPIYHSSILEKYSIKLKCSSSHTPTGGNSTFSHSSGSKQANVWISKQQNISYTLKIPPFFNVEQMKSNYPKGQTN